jgi:hypothetical protein
MMSCHVMSCHVMSSSSSPNLQSASYDISHHQDIMYPTHTSNREFLRRDENTILVSIYPVARLKYCTPNGNGDVSQPQISLRALQGVRVQRLHPQGHLADVIGIPYATVDDYALQTRAKGARIRWTVITLSCQDTYKSIQSKDKK